MVHRINSQPHFFGLIASFWVTYIPSGFVTRISDRNLGKFLEEGAKDHICVDCCSPMNFSEKREGNESRQNYEKLKSPKKPVFFRFLPENRYFSKNHLEFV